jgi:hypothetical protein
MLAPRVIAYRITAPTLRVWSSAKSAITCLVRFTVTQDYPGNSFNVLPEVMHRKLTLSNCCKIKKCLYICVNAVIIIIIIIIIILMIHPNSSLPFLSRAASSRFPHLVFLHVSCFQRLAYTEYFSFLRTRTLTEGSAVLPV